ncbi:MAG: hypothetical protein ABIB71_03445 [Candidatus Woesearchaeota archaeon]
MKTWKKCIVLGSLLGIALGNQYLTKESEEPAEETSTSTQITTKHHGLLNHMGSWMQQLDDMSFITGYIASKKYLEAAEEFENRQYYEEAGFLYYNLAELCHRNELRAQYDSNEEMEELLFEAKETHLDDVNFIYSLIIDDNEDIDFDFQNPINSKEEFPLTIEQSISYEESEELCRQLKEKFKSDSVYKKASEKAVELFNDYGMPGKAADIYLNFHRFQEAVELYEQDSDFRKAAYAKVLEAEAHYDNDPIKLKQAYGYAMEHEAYDVAVMAQESMKDYEGVVSTVEEIILDHGFEVKDIWKLPKDTKESYYEALGMTGQKHKLDTLLEAGEKNFYLDLWIAWLEDPDIF